MDHNVTVRCDWYINTNDNAEPVQCTLRASGLIQEDGWPDLHYCYLHLGKFILNSSTRGDTAFTNANKTLVTSMDDNKYDSR